MLAEQVHPYTNEPLERQPADLVARDGRQHGNQISGKAGRASAAARTASTRSTVCVAGARWRSTARPISTSNNAEFETEESRDTASPVGQFVKEESATADRPPGDIDHRHPRLHRLRRLRRPLQSGRLAHGGRKGDGRSAPSQRLRHGRPLRGCLPDECREPAGGNRGTPGRTHGGGNQVARHAKGGLTRRCSISEQSIAVI